ncbi:MAG: DUF3500 domain-containing protein, partial [Planctomycetota bacterium]|nr:DUF3500 domain-containing protein [Planctomycetota bacterium]
MKRDANPGPRIEVCSDCRGDGDGVSRDGVSRRDFLRTVGATAAVVGAAASPLGSLLGAEKKDKSKPAETYVKLLHDSLSAEQRKVMHFPFDHEKRSMISNNWNIVEPKVGAIGQLYTSDQKEIIRKILQGVTSEDGYERFQKQMKDDAGGFEKYTCALFGKPGEDKFEFVLTGRHLTIRADDNSVENTAFGGPIFYGHAVTFHEQPDHPGNVWWHQARLANEVYKSLDGKQREKALLAKSPPDNASTIRLRGQKGDIPGMPVAELSGDQKGLIKKTLKSLMNMYRESDVEEVMKCVEKNGGVDKLRLSFYRDEDIGDDGIWDRWRVEGPAFVWYFRGSPHVHTWVNVAHSAPGDSAPGNSAPGDSA